MKLDLLMPGLPAKADHFLFGICSLTLLRDGQRTILFDAGPYRVRTGLIAALQTHGLVPEQIDTVFVSHLHWDHVENLDLFGHAEILVPRSEFDYAGAIRPSDWGTPPFVREILHGMRVTLLEDREQEVFPGVTTLCLPGHSIGLMGLVVEQEREKVVIASDALWSARDAARGVPDVAFFDPKQGLDSLRKAMAAGTMYIPGHDRPFRLVDGKVNFLAEYDHHMHFMLQPDGPEVACSITTRIQPDAMV
jgi:glyoxylase-like metal-dependent hydrolase (beta-lactamase superfamily II)